MSASRRAPVAWKARAELAGDAARRDSAERGAQQRHERPGPADRLAKVVQSLLGCEGDVADRAACRRDDRGEGAQDGLAQRQPARRPEPAARNPATRLLDEAGRGGCTGRRVRGILRNRGREQFRRARPPWRRALWRRRSRERPAPRNAAPRALPPARRTRSRSRPGSYLCSTREEQCSVHRGDVSERPQAPATMSAAQARRSAVTGSRRYHDVDHRRADDRESHPCRVRRSHRDELHRHRKEDGRAEAEDQVAGQWKPAVQAVGPFQAEDPRDLEERGSHDVEPRAQGCQRHGGVSIDPGGYARNAAESGCSRVFLYTDLTPLRARLNAFAGSFRALRRTTLPSRPERIGAFFWGGRIPGARGTKGGGLHAEDDRVCGGGDPGRRLRVADAAGRGRQGLPGRRGDGRRTGAAAAGRVQAPQGVGPDRPAAAGARDQRPLPARSATRRRRSAATSSTCGRTDSRT